jgi:hypothetical protein
MPVKRFKGFGGGITDFHIDAAPDKYERADNFVVDSYLNLINRPGSEMDFAQSITRARVPASVNTRRIGLLAEQKTGTAANFTLLKQSGDALYYDNGTTLTELFGPGGASAFDLSSPVSAQTAFCATSWNEHTLITHEAPFQKPVKVYRDSGGVLRLRTAGLPRPDESFLYSGGTGANYIMALVHKYTYQVGDVEFVDRSAPMFSELTNVGTVNPANSPNIAYSSLPSLANANGEHYDTANIKIEFYRTKNNGTTLYYVGEITNGTTTFTDTVSDNNLEDGITLYTSGGEIRNDRPPKAKFVHATSDFCYYASCIEVAVDSTDLELLPQRLYQSKRGDPDSVPASFFADIEEPITGISSVRSIPIVFGARSTYRIDGFVDNFGRGQLLPRKISDSVGAVGQLGIVQTNDGLFFAGSDGFYFTDGYSLTKLSEEFQDTYAELVNTELKRKRIYGSHDINDKVVLWAAEWEDNNEGSDNRRVFVMDLDTRAFTTWSSGYNGVAPTLMASGNISGTTISGISDTTGAEAGQRIFGSGISPDAYIVSVDSSTQITISSTAITGSSVPFVCLENDQNAMFYGQFRPTALLFANNKLWMGTENGYTKFFNKSIATDPKIDEVRVGATPADFDTLPILWDYRGPADALGTTEYRKWVNGILIKARPRFDLTSDVSIQPLGENDDSGFTHLLEYILLQSFYPWGTPEIPWGDPRLWSRRATIIDAKRRFPAGKMRCEYKQLQMRTAFVRKYESSVFGTATISGSGVEKTVTANVLNWADGIKDYWIKFGTDDYATQYRILNRNSNTQITIHDPQLALTAGVVDWAIFAYLKTNLIQIMEYSMFYEVIGASQTQYQGENAVNK